jgi:hypothetical protein
MCFHSRERVHFLHGAVRFPGRPSPCTMAPQFCPGMKLHSGKMDALACQTRVVELLHLRSGGCRIQLSLTILKELDHGRRENQLGGRWGLEGIVPGSPAND